MFSLVFNNLEEFMPPSTTKSSSSSPQSVRELRYTMHFTFDDLRIDYFVTAVVYRENSDELPGTSIVSLSIVETGGRYNSSGSKLTLKEPVRINYTNVEVLYLLYLSDGLTPVTVLSYSMKEMGNTPVHFGSLDGMCLSEYCFVHII